MSPEQAAGRPVDFRSDQFSLGSILYEMATGKRAFQRGTTAETLTAIIREEAEPVAQLNPGVPAPLRWIVERCLAKDPEERYASTRDLARDLKSVRDHLSEVWRHQREARARRPGPPAAKAARSRSRPRPWRPCSAAFGAGMLVQKRFAKTLPPSYQQITFGSGTIRAARFAPDGQTIVYSAAWDGDPLKLFLKHPSSPDSLPLELPSANLLAISPSGEMAIAVDCRSNHPGVCAGTLARAALTGGAPRDVAEGVQDADWARTARPSWSCATSAASRASSFRWARSSTRRPGTSATRAFRPRETGSPSSTTRFPLDDAGTVAVIDLAGKKTTLTGKWASEGGLAWSPSGDEVWFTATEAGANRSLYAVTLAGKLRVVTRVPGGLKLHDVARNGRVLLTRESPRVGILGVLQGDDRERDMSFLDYSFAADLSPDCAHAALRRGGGGGRRQLHGLRAQVRPLAGRAPRRGQRDGHLAGRQVGPLDAAGPEFPLHPAADRDRRAQGAGHRRSQPRAGRDVVPGQQADRLRGKRAGPRPAALRAGHRRGSPADLAGRDLAALPGFAVSPDGKLVAAIGPDQKGAALPRRRRGAAADRGVEDGEFPLRFSSDGRSLYVWKRGDVPARITRVDLATGRARSGRTCFPPTLPASSGSRTCS